MEIRRGEIWWATLPTPSGSEPGYRRPFLVIQSNRFNRSQIRTVVAISLTTYLRLAQAPRNLLVPAESTGLSKDSVANVSQVVTFNKSLLTERVGSLQPLLMQEVEAGLRLVFDL